MIEEALRQQNDEDNLSPSHLHLPVMVEEVLATLQPQMEGVYVDGTLGLGGHAQALLKRIGRKGRLIGIDRDKRSLEEAKSHLTGFSEQCEFVHEQFRRIDEVLKKRRIDKVDGILLDLGISTFQLDDEDRGFSFQKDGPLDMRMNQESRLMAFDLVNSLSEVEIAKILRVYGEERFSHRIARKIIEQRTLSPIRTTKDLRDIVVKSYPYRKRREKIHPATRTFQAFRIAVNHELEEVQIVIDKCVDRLKPKGRIVIISFHSLEDRIVKQKFREFAKMGMVKILTKKPLRPGDEEIESNSRARSARLRGAERL